MISFLLNGQMLTFIILLVTIILSLAFHEYGHAWSAKKFGDTTAEKLGRLTLNPIAHIDPMGLLMIVLVGFGWAKPVPTDPRNFNSFWATFFIALAGPMANLILAFLAVNLFGLFVVLDIQFLLNETVLTVVWWFSFINLLLMLFNLIPLGPLDGHYILPYFLPRSISMQYRKLNAQYGGFAVLGLVLLSYAGLPIFFWLQTAARSLLGMLQIIGPDVF